MKKCSSLGFLLASIVWFSSIDQQNAWQAEHNAQGGESNHGRILQLSRSRRHFLHNAKRDIVLPGANDQNQKDIELKALQMVAQLDKLRAAIDDVTKYGPATEESERTYQIGQMADIINHYSDEVKQRQQGTDSHEIKRILTVHQPLYKRALLAHEVRRPFKSGSRGGRSGDETTNIATQNRNLASARKRRQELVEIVEEERADIASKAHDEEDDDDDDDDDVDDDDNYEDDEVANRDDNIREVLELIEKQRKEAEKREKARRGKKKKPGWGKRKRVEYVPVPLPVPHKFPRPGKDVLQLPSDVIDSLRASSHHRHRPKPMPTIEIIEVQKKEPAAGAGPGPAPAPPPGAPAPPPPGAPPPPPPGAPPPPPGGAPPGGAPPAPPPPGGAPPPPPPGGPPPPPPPPG